MPASRVYANPPTMARHAIERTYRPTNWGAHWFGRGLARIAGGGAADIAVVHWWGDSITAGLDAETELNVVPPANNSTAQKDAWRTNAAPGVFRTGMQARYGDSGEGFQPFGMGVTTGTWTTRPGMGMAEGRATAAATVTFKVRGTTIVIFHKNANLVGSFRWQIDGGGFTTVTPPTAFGQEPGSVTIGSLSDSEHTVVIEWVSGTIGINGVRGLRAVAGVRVDRFGLSGVSASDISAGIRSSRLMSVGTTNGSPNIAAGTGGYFTQADVGSRIVAPAGGIPANTFIATVTSATAATLGNSEGVAVNATTTATLQAFIDAQPNTGTNIDGYQVGNRTFGSAFAAGVGPADLVVFALGVNDSAEGSRFSRDAFQSALSRLATFYQPAGDVDLYCPDFVFVIHHIGKWFNTEANYGVVAAAIRDTAVGLNGAVIDMWDAGRRSYKYAQNEQYWGGQAGDSQIHPSKLGHDMLGQAMLALARQ